MSHTQRCSEFFLAYFGDHVESFRDQKQVGYVQQGKCPTYCTNSSAFKHLCSKIINSFCLLITSYNPNVKSCLRLNPFWLKTQFHSLSKGKFATRTIVKTRLVMLSYTSWEHQCQLEQRDPEIARWRKQPWWEYLLSSQQSIMLLKCRMGWSTCKWNLIELVLRQSYEKQTNKKILNVSRDFHGFHQTKCIAIHNFANIENNQYVHQLDIPNTGINSSLL